MQAENASTSRPVGRGVRRGRRRTGGPGLQFLELGQAPAIRSRRLLVPGGGDAAGHGWPSRVSSAAHPARASRSRRLRRRLSRLARARSRRPRRRCALEDAGADGGVGNVEPGDHLGHRAQSVGEFVEAGGERCGPRGGGDRLDVGVQPLQGGVVGGEGVLAGQEGDGAVPEGGEVVVGVGGERVDPPVVGVPHLLQGQQMALRLTEFGASAHPGGGLAGLFAAQPAHHGGDPLGGLVEGFRGPAGEVGDRLKLGEHLLGGGADLLQRGTQVADLGVAQPVVGVQRAHAGGGEGRLVLGSGAARSRRPCCPAFSQGGR
ncbi:hypothetical protein SALBM217S_08837 [Streptomyces griseoloalbus]